MTLKKIKISFELLARAQKLDWFLLEDMLKTPLTTGCLKEINYQQRIMLYLLTCEEAELQQEVCKKELKILL